MLNEFSDRVPDQRRSARQRIVGILGGLTFMAALFAMMAALAG